MSGVYADILILVCVYVVCCFFFFFKQKTAYEMRISDWSSDVCSSDLYQFGVVERLDLDRPDIAKRDAVARVGILAVDADSTLGGDQIGVASGFELVGDALSRIHRCRRDTGVGADRQRVFVAVYPARQAHAPPRTVGLRKLAAAPAD